MIDKINNIVEACDFAVIKVYRMPLGTEFSINSLFSNVQVVFNKRNLSRVANLLLNCGLVVVAGNTRTTSCGRAGGLARTYIRIAK